MTKTWYVLNFAIELITISPVNHSIVTTKISILRMFFL
jgi:hypothetical protein